MQRGDESALRGMTMTTSGGAMTPFLKRLSMAGMMLSAGLAIVVAVQTVSGKPGFAMVGWGFLAVMLLSVSAHFSLRSEKKKLSSSFYLNMALSLNCCVIVLHIWALYTWAGEGKYIDWAYHAPIQMTCIANVLTFFLFLVNEKKRSPGRSAGSYKKR